MRENICAEHVNSNGVLQYIMEVAGCFQFCIGEDLPASQLFIVSETSIYLESFQGLLFVDSSSAFNVLHRGMALRSNLQMCL